jgi:hypothetical protein
MIPCRVPRGAFFMPGHADTGGGRCSVDSTLQRREKTGRARCSVDSTLQRREKPGRARCSVDSTLQRHADTGGACCNEETALQERTEPAAPITALPSTHQPRKNFIPRIRKH